MKRTACRCAACAGANPERLVQCTACDWRDPKRSVPAKKLLARFSARAARGAYNAGGCAVCEDCRQEFSPERDRCPLYILSLAVLPPEERPRFVVRQGYLVRLGAALRAILRRRGFPEETEVYWTRLFEWLTEEWSAFRRGRNG